jgi:hypothetical protein
MKTKFYYLAMFLIFFVAPDIMGQGDGLLIKDGKRLFPIGWYSTPKDDASLKEMAEAGINIFRCNDKEGLDRVHAVGMQGWMRVRLEDGATDKVKEKVLSVVNHPALAIWEGPDEVVWNFTGWSGLYKKLKVQEKAGAWWEQTPGAVSYANEKAKEIIPNMIDAIAYIRSVDPFNRQIWINEASRSDMTFVRQYIDYIDVTGTDKYPIGGKHNPESSGVSTNVDAIRYCTQRYTEIGKGKPVWMVLQAFSWSELTEEVKDAQPLYPTFDESRYMAYAAIAYGARGILYWGSAYTKSKEFVQSLFAVTNELAALQPFLTAPNEVQVEVKMIKTDQKDADQPVSCIARRYGRDWMIVVINETDNNQMGVLVNGLRHLNGLKLTELYGNNEVTVSNEEIVLRMKPREVIVLTTGKKWETASIKGRDYPGL